MSLGCAFSPWCVRSVTLCLAGANTRFTYTRGQRPLAFQKKWSTRAQLWSVLKEHKSLRARSFDCIDTEICPLVLWLFVAGKNYLVLVVLNCALEKGIIRTSSWFLRKDQTKEGSWLKNADIWGARVGWMPCTAFQRRPYVQIDDTLVTFNDFYLYHTDW